LSAEERVRERYQQGGRGAEHDEGVHIGVLQQVGVGEDGELENERRREELLRHHPHERVMLDEPCLPHHPHSQHARHVSQRREQPRKREVRDRVLVDHREQARVEPVSHQRFSLAALEFLSATAREHPYAHPYAHKLDFMCIIPAPPPCLPPPARETAKARLPEGGIPGVLP
jgi:hypothetical protein